MSSSSRRALPRSRFAPVNEATNASVGRSTSSLGVANWRSLSVDDHADLVGERGGVLEVVRDEDGRQRELAQELLELGAHGSLRVRVERGERLVEQDHARAARERARERDALALAARERGRPARRRGARCGSARGTRRRAPCPRTRRSGGRSGAGRARTPGRRARRGARPACGRALRLAVEPDVVAERDLPARRTDEPGDRPQHRASCPAPDGPTRATVRSTSSASSSSNERSGSVKSAREGCHREVELEGDQQRGADQDEQRADREGDVEVDLELARRSRAAASASPSAGCRRT